MAGDIKKLVWVVVAVLVSLSLGTGCTYVPAHGDSLSTPTITLTAPPLLSVQQKYLLCPGQPPGGCPDEDVINDIAFSPDGKTIAITGAAGLSVYRLNSLEPVWSAPSGAAVNAIAFSPGGNWLASGSDDKSVVLWNAATGESVRKLGGLPDWVGSLAFSPDGKRLAAGSFKLIALWDTTTWRALPSLEGQKSYIWNLAFSPSSPGLLASASVGNTIDLWDVGKGEIVRTLRGPTYWMRSVAFSSDGRRLASGAGDGSVLVWDSNSFSASGDQVLNLRAHDAYIWDLAFAPGNYILVAASEDQTVAVWDITKAAHTSGDKAGSLTPVIMKEHPTGVKSLAFSPDGTLLASGSSDGTLVLWSIKQGP